MSTTKNCSSCKVSRDISCFYNDKQKEFKTCEKCRERSRRSKNKHKEKHVEKCKNWREKNRERIQLYDKSRRNGLNWNEVKIENNLNSDVKKISPHRKPHIVIDNITGKDCSKCKQWKPLERYNKNSTHWDLLKTTCMDCYAEYRKGNKERMTIYNKQYWIKTKDIQTENHRKWKNENREHINEYSRNYMKKWEAKQRLTNPQFKILKNLRTRLWISVKNQKLLEKIEQKT